MDIRKKLSVIISLVLVVAVMSAYITANAAVTGDIAGTGDIVYPDGNIDASRGYILIEDGLASGGLNDDPEEVYIYAVSEGGSAISNDYKGISYDPSSRTLTFDNVKQDTNAFEMTLESMGRLTVELIGKSGVACLHINRSYITVVGDGELTVNPEIGILKDSADYELDGARMFYTAIDGTDCSLLITDTVKINIENEPNLSTPSTAVFRFADMVDLGETIKYLGDISDSPKWDYHYAQSYSDEIKPRHIFTLKNSSVSFFPFAELPTEAPEQPTQPEVQPTQPTTEYLLGDSDGDDEVSILDATTIQRHLAGLPVTNFVEPAADSDNDGEISILDATSIQRHLVGLSAYEGIGKYI